MTTALIFAGMMTACTLLGVLLGHVLTLRGVAHVQPSVKSLENSPTASAYTEPDPFDAEEDADKLTEREKEVFSETELPEGVISPEDFFGKSGGTIKKYGGMNES